MQPEPADERPDLDRLLHNGTLSTDGSPSWDWSWGGFENVSGGYPTSPFDPTGDAYWSNVGGLGGGDPGSAADPASGADGPVSDADAGSNAADAGGGTTNLDAAGPTSDSQANPSGLVIIADYDSSITSLPTGTYNEVTGAITAAIDYYEAKISNPITITIDFGVSSLGSGVLSDSTPTGGLLSFSTLHNALAGPVTAAGGTLVATDPFNNSDEFYVTNAERAALGLPVGRGAAGDVELSSTASFAYSPTDRAVAGEWDAIGALEHEISEIMGRVAYYPTPDESYSPLDLFRYSSAGTIATGGGAAYFSIDNGATNLAEYNNNTAYSGDPGDWSSHPGDIDPVNNDSYDAYSSSGVENAVSAVDLTEMQMLGYTLAPACYAAGTRILTMRGEVPVEDLAIGDMVQTRFAGFVPVKWIGHRRIDCRRHPDPEQVWPVRIVAGAFADRVPHRDLLLSPDHAVAVGDVLVAIRLLANGASIRQETGRPQVQYFHVELDRHDLLLADGLAAESYLDTGNRGMFANAGVPLVLHPRPVEDAAQRQREAMSCLPFCCDPAQVEPLWRALAARAEALGFTLPEVATTDDPALCIVAGGQRFTPTVRGDGRYTFVVPALPGGARLQSRCAAPSALRPWLDDRRRLGVMVRRIVLRSTQSLVEVAPDDPSLADGWWAAERDDAAIWRWTDGDAALPPIEDLTIVEVSVGGTLPYPLSQPTPVSAAVRPAISTLAAQRSVAG